MKQKQAVFLLVFYSCAYVLLLALAGYRIFDSRARAIRSSGADFISLGALAQSALGQGKSFSSKIFLEQVRNRFAGDSSLLCLSITEKDGSLGYAIPASSSLTDKPLSTRSKLPALFRDFLSAAARFSVYERTGSIQGPDSESLSLTAVYTAVSTQSASVAVRDSLIGIVILLFIAGVILLILNLSEDAPASEAQGPLPAMEYRYEPENSEPPRMSEEFSIPSFSMSDAETQVKPSPLSDSLPPLNDGFPEPDAIDETPSGLYSPRSGLGWETYLGERLEAELSRNASLGLDCSFLLIRAPGIDADEEGYRSLASRIADFFSFRDIAFERGRDEFAVILPGKDIEQAFQAARDFIALAPESARIGVSSRSGRRVNSATVLEEALSALEKACAELESPIVGFRADPERYRSFIAGKL